MKASFGHSSVNILYLKYKNSVSYIKKMSSLGTYMKIFKGFGVVYKHAAMMAWTASHLVFRV